MNPLCIIPARGGSKGLPNKHLLELETQPVIDWTIQAARGIPTVVVSSDSNRILERATQAQLKTPFVRLLSIWSIILMDPMTQSYGYKPIALYETHMRFIPC